MMRVGMTWSFAVLVLIPAVAGAQAESAPLLDLPSNLRPPAHAINSPTDPVKDGTTTGATAKEPDKKEADKLTALDQKIDAITNNLTVTTADPQIKVVIGGAVIADFLFNSARPVAPGTPFFLTSGPPPGFRQQTFDASARQTTLSALVSGPEICGYQSSAVVAANLYSSSLVEDLWGFLPFQVYAQLKNDDWRYAVGLQSDIFNPLNPTVLPVSYLGASGNTGAFRGQARIERYFHPSDDQQITFTAGLSDPVPTTVSNTFRLSEDNGWPNLEGRAAWALGPLSSEGPLATRPFEIGVSGVVGQIRTTVPFTRQVVANCWGLGTDIRWAVTKRLAFKASSLPAKRWARTWAVFCRIFNASTFAGVHAAGGWIELYYYICPEKLHAHVGYGIDDPLDRDLAPGQAVRNDTYFANLIWDIGKHFRVAEEFTYRKTAYTLVPNNDGFRLQTQVQFKF